MAERKKILLVDDNLINLQILDRILSDSYDTVFATDGAQALEVVAKPENKISVILLDILMPKMDGYEFLERFSAMPQAKSIPVIVTSQQDNDESEVKALALGAYDFLAKPYRATIIKQRIANILKLKETASFVNTAESDALTGLYNRDAFFRHARNAINASPDKKFILLTLDIERFKLINDIFGVDEGDKLLKYIADIMKANCPKDALCARLGGDVFVMMITDDGSGRKFCDADFEPLEKTLNDYPLNINIAVKFGVYYVHRPNAAISVMCDHAKLACESIKGKYDVKFALYDDSMRSAILLEQEISNDMWRALHEEQFEVYFQPKYDLDSGYIAGAEALVRWRHPQKGFMSPAQFIPLFEKNGFITDLDMYVWEKVCAAIKGWTDAGVPIVPISVNVSRVDIYNPNLAEILMKTVEKYGVSTEYLHLEITETAYTENPQQIIDTIAKLHDLGFSIEMDDFGTGYSSLNMLNELPLDVLKLDMRFLQGENGEDKKSNIINFLVSLAKWLGLSVVAEGVETLEQVLFLRSMSCNLGQGYYFAKPLAKSDFENMLRENKSRASGEKNITVELVRVEDIWNPLSQFSVIFNCYVGALGIFEAVGDKLSLIRANDHFFEVIPSPRERLYNNGYNVLDSIHPEDREMLLADIKKVSGDYAEVTNYSRWFVGGLERDMRWLHIKCKTLRSEDGRSLLLASIDDFTERKVMEKKLIDSRNEMESQREFFARIFQMAPCSMAQFDDEGRIVIANNAMVRMLGFDSIQEFKSADRYFWNFVTPECREQIMQKLPSIINSGSGSFDSLEFGIVTNSAKQMWVKCSIQAGKYNDSMLYQCAVTDITEIKNNEHALRETAQRDSLTGLLNQKAFEESVSSILAECGDSVCAFMMLDIDKFEQINAIGGRIAGDEALCVAADIIKNCLRSGDIIARLSADEFAVFINYSASEKVAIDRSRMIYNSIAEQLKGRLGVTLSAGVSMAPNHGRSFNELYASADMALYRAKSDGGSAVRILGVR